MNKTKIGIFFTLLLVLGVCSSCGEKKSNNKLVLNEVLITNEGNYQDDYGLHSAWIEIFNRSYGSADLAGCYLKFKNGRDSASYFIPKGDTSSACIILGRWRSKTWYIPHKLHLESG